MSPELRFSTSRCNRVIKSLPWACLLFGLLSSYVLAQPPRDIPTEEVEQFIVHHAASNLLNDVYVLNAEIEYRFTPAVLEALENGVPLILEMHIEITRPRDWLWDAQFTDLVQRYRLQYHALTEQYLVKNLNSDIQYNFPSREAAIDALGTITDLPILDKRLLEPGIEYQARLRTSLDLEALPTPLRLLAYLSPQWHLESEWYTWPLQS